MLDFKNYVETDDYIINMENEWFETKKEFHVLYDYENLLYLIQQTLDSNGVLKVRIKIPSRKSSLSILTKQKFTWDDRQIRWNNHDNIKCENWIMLLKKYFNPESNLIFNDKKRIKGIMSLLKKGLWGYNGESLKYYKRS